ncbi:DUF4236 domain-containing protein [Variovorax sp. SRS16]|uniref:DUF4236 domain-containing protein n=1 Tax=Variovorax sp. SRS16 TaxID=282217 RepID=UPI0013A5A8C4|nr:DUF4236 domain-containing protein [Variovorax sp. SRS16]
MGFRLNRRIKILPGVRLNLSKSGISTSIGGKGATVNIGRGKTRVTTSLPGNGLSYVTVHRHADPAKPKAPSALRMFWYGLLSGLFGRR